MITGKITISFSMDPIEQALQEVHRNRYANENVPQWSKHVPVYKLLVNLILQKIITLEPTGGPLLEEICQGSRLFMEYPNRKFSSNLWTLRVWIIGLGGLTKFLEHKDFKHLKPWAFTTTPLPNDDAIVPPAANGKCYLCCWLLGVLCSSPCCVWLDLFAFALLHVSTTASYCCSSL